MSSAFPLPGALDGWTSRRGAAYERSVRRARVALWARSAEQQEDELLALARSRRSQVPEASALGWRSLGKLRRDKYLRGESTPNGATLDAVRQFAPLSFQVFHHEIWAALSSKADMATCARIQLIMGGEKHAHTLAQSLCSPQATSPRLNNLDDIALLVSAIRLAMGQKRPSDAFEYGQALVYAVLLLSVNPYFRGGYSGLARVVGQGVLEGLTDGKWQVHCAGEVLDDVGFALCERCVDLTVLAGGVLRLAYGPPLKPETLADLFHPHASALCMPSPAVHEDLLDLLERSSSHASRIRKLDSGIAKRLYATSLFKKVG